MTIRAFPGSPCAAAALAVALLCNACTSTPLVKSAVSANIIQEEAHNQLLALNIVRAMHRMPMHFTQVSAIRTAPYGSVFTPGGGVEFGLGGAATRLITFKPNLSSSLQNIDVAVLNSQEFMQGMTSPVNVSLMLYFLDQGWPPAMVLHLFVHAIEVYDGAGKLESRYRNNPDFDLDEKANYTAFRELLWSIAQCEVRSESVKAAPTYYSGPINIKTLTDLGDIAAAKTAGLSPFPYAASAPGPAASAAEPVALRFGVEKQELSLRLAAPPGGSEKQCESMEIPDDSTGPSKQKDGPQGGAKRLVQMQVLTTRKQVDEMMDPKSALYRPPAADGATSTRSLRLVMRSPEAMIYYLGEVVRAGSGGQHTCQLSPPSASGGCHVLFDMQAGGDKSSAAFLVEYQGVSYAVPPFSKSNRSVQTLSMLNQIMSLQNKGLVPPTTGTVRVLQ